MCAGYGLACGCCCFRCIFQLLGAAPSHVVLPCVGVCIRGGPFGRGSFRFATGIAASICCSVIGGCIAWPPTQTWVSVTAVSLYFARNNLTGQNETSLVVFRFISFVGGGTRLLVRSISLCGWRCEWFRYSCTDQIRWVHIQGYCSILFSGNKWDRQLRFSKKELGHQLHQQIRFNYS